MPSPVELTPCRPEFRDRVVDLWRASFALRVGAPAPSDVADHRRFFDEHVRAETSVTLALRDGALLGFGAFRPVSVMPLYVVDVDHLRQGIGSRLLDLAKAGSDGRPWLHTFDTNTCAPRFYEHHGFDIVERGVEPAMQRGDLRHEWRRPS